MHCPGDVDRRRRLEEAVPRRHGTALSCADLKTHIAIGFVTGIGAPERLAAGIGSGLAIRSNQMPVLAVGWRVPP